MRTRHIRDAPLKLWSKYLCNVFDVLSEVNLLDKSKDKEASNAGCP